MDVDTFESWCDRGGKSTVGKWLAAFWKTSGVSNERVGPRGNRMILSADKLVFWAFRRVGEEASWNSGSDPLEKGAALQVFHGKLRSPLEYPEYSSRILRFFNQVEFISSCFSPSIDGNYEYRAFGFLDNLIVIKLCELFANFHNFLLTFSQFCKFIELCKKFYISITWLILQVCKLWDFVNFNFIILLTL